MALRVNHNSATMDSLRNLENNTIGLNRSLERLSSGLRINRAGDDPAGLIISEELRGQIAGIQASQRAVGESVNFFNVAEAGLNEVNTMLVNMRGLATEAINGSTTTQQRQALNFEFQNAAASIKRIFNKSNFAGDTIFNLSAAATIANGRVFQLGEDAGNNITFAFKNATSGGTLTINGTTITFGVAAGTATGFAGLVNGSSTDLLNATNGAVALSRIEESIVNISLYRGAIGAFNRNIFESQQRFLGIYLQNLTASESYIRDTNMAQETSTFTRNQIMVQASTAMLAQANTVSQNVLQLLK
jgi:flagellin